ncbi:MAG: acyltransferase family protein [Muribaculaceae bacterium]
MSDKQQTTAKRPQRLLALDILRGITIAGMILVNNPGSWGHIYAPLAHAQWHGLTPTDLVFPFFMYIMGISTYFSLRKYDFKFSGATLWKICRRTVVIFAIGLAIAWFGMFLRGITSGAALADAVFTFDHIRILGVMPRLAICYGLGSLIALALSKKALPWFIAAMLVVYAVILFVGNGFEFASNNVIAIVDNAVLGPDHMYTDHVGGESLKFDPEGLLSTLPSIAHMLIGFVCGGIIVATKDNNLRINKLFIIGTILTFSGFLLDFGIPINKKIWSPTFVLTTCGLASSFLGLLIWIIDIKGYRRWCRFFEAFGINPLFMYCLGAVLSIIIGAIKVPYAAVESGVTTLKGWIYQAVLMPACADNATLASLCFAILFVLLNWCIGDILYKKKIYIKI